LKIYTKTGDTGQTGLVGGGRTSKASVRVEAIGCVDELNSTIGLVRVVGTDDEAIESLLEAIQSRLFDIGGEVASPPSTARRVENLSSDQIKELEASIDVQTAALPELRNFILPGGSELAARLHLARAVCRRAERAVLALHKQEPQRGEILMYLNRLSDWLFVAARTANRLEGVEDVAWKGR
jgi:cob(I)alamin adenosyltransferase